MVTFTSTRRLRRLGVVISRSTCLIFSNGLTGKSLSASARTNREGRVRKLGLQRDAEKD